MPIKPKRPSSTKPRAVVRDDSEPVGMPNLANLEVIVTQLLENLGENPQRHGLTDTPKRVAKSLAFLTKGYQQDIDELLNWALFPIDYD